MEREIVTGPVGFNKCVRLVHISKGRGQWPRRSASCPTPARAAARAKPLNAAASGLLRPGARPDALGALPPALLPHKPVPAEQLRGQPVPPRNRRHPLAAPPARRTPPPPSRRPPRSRRRSVLSAPHPTPARPDPVNTSSRRVDSGLDLVKSLVSDMCPACAIQVGQSPMSARRLAYNRSCLQ